MSLYSSSQEFPALQPQIVFFLQCDWQLENHPQTAINVNEAQGVGCHQTLSSWVGSGHETMWSSLCCSCCSAKTNCLFQPQTGHSGYRQAEEPVRQPERKFPSHLQPYNHYLADNPIFVKITTKALKCSCSDSSQMVSVVRYMGSGCLFN